jgi:hypothetical protein
MFELQQVKTCSALARNKMTPGPVKRLAQKRGSGIVMRAADRGDMKFLMKMRRHNKLVKKLPKC